MRYYVDTEFNGNGGQLLSVGIVRQDGEQFYQELHVHELPQPWIKKNVVPVMLGRPVSRAACSFGLQQFLLRDRGPHTFVVDWPEDAVHLGNLMVTDHGTRMPPRRWRCVLLELPGFHTADHSKRPHNALDDAVALRNYVERGIAEGMDGELTDGDLAFLRGT